ncbi:MerR family transcriptional regulator [Paractinoplanes brasiliensis]|uniref:MerR family transcriptional regulator n=1 Tax=Paractinoplanes brasiliensis TaxID=52695 RepID=UPI00105B8E70|nr:MerR family transcriptional regulator [Actinoplanes brasiliensis]
MRIGELAARAGVSTRSLRYYEQQNLLPAERTSTGQRRYTEPAIDRVKLIQRLYAANLSSRTIAELLPCPRAGITPQVAQSRLAAERERIDAQIAELTRARTQLTEVMAELDHPMDDCL